MSSPLFTVFTPTFNRAHTLGRVYESLVRQTFRDFEWLVVDDGSTDDTKALVRRWAEEAAFPIRYEHQPNQGKHVAFNRAVQLARGPLFLCFDSDDVLLPDALALFRDAWHECGDGFCGVTGRCVDEAGRLIGLPLPRSPLDVSSLDLKYRHKIHGEKCGFVRTDILRQYPFPVVAGTKYVPEGVVWAQIARHHITRYIDKPVRVYHQNTDEQIMARSPATYAAGLAYWHRSVLNHEIGYFRHAPKGIVVSAINYVRFSLHCGIGSCSILAQAGGPLAVTLVLIVAPLSLAIFWRDR
jgi:glycosyltransferase involved in cell wall biosynthesis